MHNFIKVATVVFHVACSETLFQTRGSLFTTRSASQLTNRRTEVQNRFIINTLQHTLLRDLFKLTSGFGICFACLCQQLPHPRGVNQTTVVMSRPESSSVPTLIRNSLAQLRLLHIGLPLHPLLDTCTNLSKCNLLWKAKLDDNIAQYN